MAAIQVERRVREREVFAVLLGLSAIVVPFSGALLYWDMADLDGRLPWQMPFLGAADRSDLVGPALLVGALALGVVASRSRIGRHQLPVPLLAVIVVVAGLVQGVAFGISAIDLARGGLYALPPGGAWSAARWTLVARLGIQALICLVAAVFGVRWANPSSRRT